MPVSITILYSSPLRISSRRGAHRECDRKKQFQFNASRNFSFWSSKCGAGEASAKFQIGRRATFFLSYSSDSLFSLIIKKFSSRNLQWHIEMAIMNLEIEHDGLLSFSGLIFCSRMQCDFGRIWERNLKRLCLDVFASISVDILPAHITAVKQKVEELVLSPTEWPISDELWSL